MISCEFISIEDDEPDIVISFSCAKEIYDQEQDVIIQRTPKYEYALPEYERGAHVSVGYGSDEINVLKSIELSGRNVIIKGDRVIEERDCEKIDNDEWAYFKDALMKMNFDNSFELKIA